MILVSGATGNIGGELVRRLIDDGCKVRALTRNPAQAKLPAACEIARGNLLDPESLDKALVGVKKAFLLGQALELPEIARTFISAAKRAGVQQVVFNSSSTIEMKISTMIGRAHLEAETELKKSGLNWTILRPGNFSSNTLRWAGSIKTQGSVFATGGDGKSAPVDPRDIAAVASAALSKSGHEGKTYVLTGPKVLTTREQVEEIGTVIGKPLRFVEVSGEGARAGMLKSGMPEAIVNAMVDLIAAVALEPEARITSTVREVTGHEARSFADWARDHAAAFT